MKRTSESASQKRIEVMAETPRVPNFIRTNVGPVDVGAFSDADLQDLGKRWTDALVRLAAMRRRDKTIKNGKEDRP